MKTRLNFAVALWAAFVLQTTAEGADYFVNKQGNDANDGASRATSFLTIQKGVDALKPGDTLTIGPGEYLESVRRADLGAAVAGDAGHPGGDGVRCERAGQAEATPVLEPPPRLAVLSRGPPSLARARPRAETSQHPGRLPTAQTTATQQHAQIPTLLEKTARWPRRGRRSRRKRARGPPALPKRAAAPAAPSEQACVRAKSVLRPAAVLPSSERRRQVRTSDSRVFHVKHRR